MGATVVAAGNCAETLLPGSVPDLEFDALAVKLDCPDLKIDSNGGNV